MNSLLSIQRFVDSLIIFPFFARPSHELFVASFVSTNGQVMVGCILSVAPLILARDLAVHHIDQEIVSGSWAVVCENLAQCGAMNKASVDLSALNPSTQSRIPRLLTLRASQG